MQPMNLIEKQDCAHSVHDLTHAFNSYAFLPRI